MTATTLQNANAPEHFDGINWPLDGNSYFYLIFLLVIRSFLILFPGRISNLKICLTSHNNAVRFDHVIILFSLVQECFVQMDMGQNEATIASVAIYY